MIKYYFISLGCDKNFVDSEHLLYMLDSHGLIITDEPDEADIIIVNTCCFIGDALQESIDTVLEMSTYKNTGNLKGLIVCGCMGERYFDEIEELLPEVDAVVGVNSYDKLIEVIYSVLDGKKSFIKSEILCPANSKGRFITGFDQYAFLKIAEGCNKNCSYCVIPQIRGNYRSTPMEDLIDEAKKLVESNVKEIILIAQETTCYGIDLYKEKKLPELISRLSKIPELEWIRIMYAYPEEIDDNLIAEMASNPKVCHYIDMPIQHCNDAILKRMGRRTNKNSIVNVINKLKKAMPDIAIRTTLICGFPGETEDMHEELVEFILDNQFDRLGAFAYSREENTKAYDFDDQIDDKIKEKRYSRIMEVQKSISYAKEHSMIGKTLSVMVLGFMEDEGVYVARSYRDAPDIDGVVFFESESDILSGTFVDVMIESSNGYDLIGRRIIDESC